MERKNGLVAHLGRNIDALVNDLKSRYDDPIKEEYLPCKELNKVTKLYDAPKGIKDVIYWAMEGALEGTGYPNYSPSAFDVLQLFFIPVLAKLIDDFVVALNPYYLGHIPKRIWDVDTDTNSYEFTDIFVIAENQSEWYYDNKRYRAISWKKETWPGADVWEIEAYPPATWRSVIEHKDFVYHKDDSYLY